MFSQRLLLLFLAFCLVALILVMIADSDSALSSKFSPSGLASVNPEISKRAGLNEGAESKRSAHSTKNRTHTRRKRFEELQAKWIALDSQKGSLAERNQLAKETVDLLSCTEELVELSKFLQSNSVSIGDMFTLEQGAENLFKFENSSAARLDLIKFIRNVGNKYIAIQADWSLQAGENCPSSEFVEFHSELLNTSEFAASMALIGQNNKRVLTEPEESIASSLLAIKNAPQGKIYLNGQLEALKSNADFVEIDSMLHNSKNFGLEINDSQEYLFKAWAIADPKAATQYVLANKERLGSNVITEIGRRGVGDYNADLQWLEAIERGTYQDAAAVGLVWKYSTERISEAKCIAALIGDSKLRESVLASLRIKEKARSEGETEGG